MEVRGGRRQAWDERRRADDGRDGKGLFRGIGEGVPRAALHGARPVARMAVHHVQRHGVAFGHRGQRRKHDHALPRLHRRVRRGAAACGLPAGKGAPRAGPARVRDGGRGRFGCRVSAGHPGGSLLPVLPARLRCDFRPVPHGRRVGRTGVGGHAGRLRAALRRPAAPAGRSVRRPFACRGRLDVLPGHRRARVGPGGGRAVFGRHRGVRGASPCGRRLGVSAGRWRNARGRGRPPRGKARPQRGRARRRRGGGSFPPSRSRSLPSCRSRSRSS